MGAPLMALVSASVLLLGVVQGLECGKQTIRNGRIVGGGDAFDGEFPFLVSIRLGGRTFGQHHCGGVILRQQWVLTAGHCVNSYSQRQFVVRAGEYRLGGPEANHSSSDHPVERIVLHPRLFRPRRYSNDVALLRLRTPLQYGGYAWPACLPPHRSASFAGRSAHVVGWGYTTERGSARSDVLQKVEVPVLNRTQCQALYDEAKRRVRFQEGQICAGYRDGQKDSCQGDSGGPLVVREEGRFVVVGVVSAGVGCARPLLPGIYSHVPEYLPWIEETLGDSLL